MDSRVEKLIIYLCRNDRFCTAKDLAVHLNISIRTLYRLIPLTARWLNKQGLSLLSKPNNGYKIEGSTKEIIIKLKNEQPDHLSLSIAERQKMILLYLLVNHRTMKIGEVASVFFMSDTCINNDLAILENSILPYHLQLHKQKGSGIKLTGDELSLRSCFIETFMSLITYDVFINYLRPKKNSDAIDSPEMKKISHCFNLLNIEFECEQLKKVLKSLERNLGYRFSYSGFATLLIYLIIIKKVITKKEMQWQLPDYPVHANYLSIAGIILKKAISTENMKQIADQEIYSFALLISAMEIGEISQPAFHVYFSGFNEPLSKILLNTLVEIEDKTGYFLQFDQQLKNAFIASLSTLIIRSKNNIPIWHENWLKDRQPSFIEREFSQSISQAISEKMEIQLREDDLKILQLSFSALLEDTRKRSKRKIRTCIVCFEGIGLAAYLKARLIKLITDLYIVDLVSYHRIDRNFIIDNLIQLVISTYPLPQLGIPVFVIDLPLDESKTQSAIRKTIMQVRKDQSQKMMSPDIKKETTGKSEMVTVDIVLKLIDHFFCLKQEKLADINQIIQNVIETIDIPEKKKKALGNDFIKREKQGELIFEEWGIRIIHCRSKSLAEPIAGVIQKQGTLKENINYQALLMIAAPYNAEKKILNGLSSLITALSDESEFANILAYGSLKTIKRFLLWMYGNYMQF